MNSAIYIRASDTTRLAEQEQAVRDLARARGHRICEAHVYKDEDGDTGPGRQPGLDAALGAAEAKLIDTLLVADASRLSRHPQYLATIIVRLLSAGVRLLFAADRMQANLHEGPPDKLAAGALGHPERVSTYHVSVPATCGVEAPTRLLVNTDNLVQAIDICTSVLDGTGWNRDGGLL